MGRFARRLLPLGAAAIVLILSGAGTADRSSQAALLELGRQIMAMAGERETGENGH